MNPPFSLSLLPNTHASSFSSNTHTLTHTRHTRALAFGRAIHHLSHVCQSHTTTHMSQRLRLAAGSAPTKSPISNAKEKEPFFMVACLTKCLTHVPPKSLHFGALHFSSLSHMCLTHTSKRRSPEAGSARRERRKEERAHACLDPKSISRVCVSLPHTCSTKNFLEYSGCRTRPLNQRISTPAHSNG